MKRELISKADFAKATHLERFTIAADALMSISGIHKLNQLYTNALQEDQRSFVESIFHQLSISIVFDEKELSRIPTKGAFITVSNHPFGALDGLLLLYLVTKVRSDFKVMANFLLKEVEPIAESFISVNPFENKKELSSSLKGIKQSIAQLKAGHGMGIFPAGEVSSFKTTQLQITDKQWNPSVIKLIHKSKVPIIPIHFKGTNSLFFQLLGFIHPSLRTIALPSEMLKKKESSIRVRIGKKVKVKDQQEWNDIGQFGRFLRAKTYALESSIKVKPFFKQTFKTTASPSDIAAPVEQTLLEQEIRSVQHLKLKQQANFELYLASAEEIPHLLNEIGRLREITFRAVGEGSNKARDLDEYDLYYHHLFLWDKEEQRIAGAYRLGKGKAIFSAYGKKGFYLHSLFKLKKDFVPILQKSIEMGRSFIVKDYQQKRLPLFILWQGIVDFLLENKEYQYLMGPVSISNSYSKLSKMLMVQFIKTCYFNKALSDLVEPRNKFKVKFKKVEGNTLLENVKDDVKKVDQLISDIEPNHAPVPVLIKKYLRQNAKIIGFNLDPKFNNALDGFMILDLKDLPEDSIVSLSAKAESSI